MQRGAALQISRAVGAELAAGHGDLACAADLLAALGAEVGGLNRRHRDPCSVQPAGVLDFGLDEVGGAVGVIHR